MSPSPRAEGASPSSGDPLHEKRVVLCVTGGIAAYKSAYLTRALVKAGARVHVVMTPNAQRFVGPITFETLSGNPVVTSTFERVHSMGAVEHIDVATWAEVVVVAPASYDIIGKVNAGIADCPVSTFLTAVTCPVFLAPAMNDHMWRNPVNQRNVAALGALGYEIIDPERGGLACSWEGEGRMREPDDIVEALRAGLRRLAPGGTPRAREASLAGRTILVSAGATRESIDPVRFLGNRSTGKMGYALAAAAAARGARVLLVTGPTALPMPAGVHAVRAVETADDMQRALEAWIDESDALLMAAAVADYRPARPAAAKMKRGDGGMQLDLVPTSDILKALGSRKGHRLYVGFALETGDPEKEARDKLKRKGLDLVVANQVGESTGPGTDTNQVWIYDANGLVLATPVAAKSVVADAIVDLVAERLARREAEAGARR